MRSASAPADRNGISDRNAQRCHDDRIGNAREQRLNISHVDFGGSAKLARSMLAKRLSADAVSASRPLAYDFN